MYPTSYYDKERLSMLKEALAGSRPLGEVPWSREPQAHVRGEQSLRARYKELVPS